MDGTTHLGCLQYDVGFVFPAAAHSLRIHEHYDQTEIHYHIVLTDVNIGRIIMDNRTATTDQHCVDLNGSCSGRSGVLDV